MGTEDEDITFSKELVLIMGSLSKTTKHNARPYPPSPSFSSVAHPVCYRQRSYLSNITTTYPITLSTFYSIQTQGKERAQSSVSHTSMGYFWGWLAPPSDTKKSPIQMIKCDGSLPIHFQSGPLMTPPPPKPSKSQKLVGHGQSMQGPNTCSLDGA